MDRKTLLGEMLKVFPERNVSVDPAILYAYSRDVSSETGAPDIVVRPESPEEVEKVVKFAAENRVPVIPRGAATGAAGGVVPERGGIVLDFTAMNEVLSVDLENRSVTVQPGVVQQDLNDYLEPLGFFFPVIPGSSAMCTIGGMVGNDASGRKTIMYGTTKEWVRNLEVVFPDGRRSWLARPVLKSVAGYDLVHLFVGSEGTLGVVTGITLKIAPIPRESRVIEAVFDDLGNAGRTIGAVNETFVTPSAMEILDRSSIAAIRAYDPDLEWPRSADSAEAILLIEVEGDLKEALVPQVDTIRRVCESNGAVEVIVASSTEESDDLWAARSLVGAASNNVREGYSRVYVGEDIVVPVPKIPEILGVLRKLSAKYDFPIVVFGHIGDGNLHPAVTIRKEEACDNESLWDLEREIHEAVLSMNGSVTGEHGIGRARKKYMPKQLGFVYDFMEKIKRALDPDDIMNPGVLFDDYGRGG
ncbi:MAG: FAD-binding oxidoreductase [Promethearchaeota archaeon]